MYTSWYKYKFVSSCVYLHILKILYNPSCVRFVSFHFTWFLPNQEYVEENEPFATFRESRETAYSSCALLGTS